MTSGPTTPHPVLVHIGYHKTGSSWLQRRLFGMPRAMDQVPRSPRTNGPSFTMSWSRRDIARWLVWDDPFSFDADGARSFFAPGIKSATRASLVPVVSHERLSGLPQIGGYDSREIADRLAVVFPSARILIVVREQASMMISIWKEYVERGGIRSLERFVTQHGSAGFLGYLARHFEYDKLIAYYQDLFGKGNVLVLPFELLAREPASFVEKLSFFVGTAPPSNIDYSTENPSLSPIATAMKRFLNLAAIPVDVDLLPQLRINARFASLIRRMDRVLPPWLSSPHVESMNRAIEAILGSRYAMSNRTTSELIGIDLATYGYKCQIKKDL